jgi:glutaredoxin
MKILVIGGKGCFFCLKAKAMLNSLNLKFTYQDVKEYPEAKTKILDMGLNKIPQIFINEVHIGGADELGTYLATLKLSTYEDTE